MPTFNFGFDLGKKERRKYKIEDEERQAFTALWNQAITDLNVPYLRSVEKQAREYGLELGEDTKAVLITQAVGADYLESIGGLEDIPTTTEYRGEGEWEEYERKPYTRPTEELPHPSGVVSRPGPGGEAEFFAGVPQTEQITARTAASAQGTIEGTLTGQENTRDRRQRLALEERTSKLGEKLFAQSLKDDEVLQYPEEHDRFRVLTTSN
jgi:hypothetical protein